MTKVALVTGGSRGIGRAIAIKLASQGYDVAINYHGNEASANEVKSICESKGVKAMIIQADVASFESCQKMVEAVNATLGTISVLVNNAGKTQDQLMMMMEAESFMDVVNTNLVGTFNCMKLVMRQMIKQKYGRIVNMSSVVGITGNAGQTNYSASKAGVLGLTKSAAREVAGKNVLINAVAPGFIETDMTNVLSDQVKESVIGQIPLKRYGKAEDIANMVAFLVSDQADYITGQVFNVDGGMVM